LAQFVGSREKADALILSFDSKATGGMNLGSPIGIPRYSDTWGA
jgi:hypothetical protein